jgi:phenylalanyl-tRNA synthetase beta chain
MKISLQWLGEWVDTGKDVRGLAHALTMVGLEVEAIQPAAPPLANVVVGEVRSIIPTPRNSTSAASGADAKSCRLFAVRRTCASA